MEGCVHNDYCLCTLCQKVAFKEKVDASDYEPHKIFKFHPYSFPTSKTMLSQLEKSKQIRKYKFYIIKHYYEKTSKTNLIEIMQKAENKP